MARKSPQNRKAITLRTLRRRVPMQLVALATKAGISAGYLSEIERGRRMPSPYAVKRIAAALGKDFSKLYALIETAHRRRTR